MTDEAVGAVAAPVSDEERGYREGTWGSLPNYTSLDGRFSTLELSHMEQYVAEQRRMEARHAGRPAATVPVVKERVIPEAGISPAESLARGRAILDRQAAAEAAAPNVSGETAAPPDGDSGGSGNA